MLKLYKSKSLGDIHYLITYNGNIIGMKGKTDPESKKLVVFKNAKKPTATIANAMREAIKQIDPNADICVIPSHTPKLNNLQIALNNQSIVKKYETTPRKTNHHKPIDSDYINSIEINHVKTSNALILIDDVITTGKSIECYLNLMSKYGYEKINMEILPEYYTLESVIERAHLWRASSERSKHFVNDIEAHKNSEYVNHREQYRKLTKRQDVDECKLKTAEV